ncbi:hypothetical protein HELRODRAFT_178648 [Helobdella robusta]|uniref:Uncharacterized protein n=1 Tax=Helobdella robusta TaxID=6412 RepID=T1FDI1_HELRO|nr:hypothetical protein HELRODRAFT_178648 [Helobdella robusta]ESN96848.1 hypothetical protein HELRODRAFT_178648 [Helobdella robusta]
MKVKKLVRHLVIHCGELDKARQKSQMGKHRHSQGGAQGSVKFAQFKRVNVFGCTQEVHQLGQTEGIADNSQGIMGRKTGNTTQGEFELRELLVKKLYLVIALDQECA